jgi:hypothetical protein
MARTRTLTLLGLLSAGVVSAGAGLWACSSDGDKHGAQNGEAGAPETGNGEGGENPDGANADGAPTTPPTPKEACIAYLKAACARREECTGFLASSCEQSLLGFCPDYFFSPGSSRTADGTIACAAVRRTQSCEEVALGIDPPCATPGMLQGGAECHFAGQCASMDCSGGSSGACGTCRKIKPPGPGCPVLDESCGQNMTCTNADAGCVAKTVPALLAPGAGCALDAGVDAAHCPVDTPCAATTASATNGACSPPPPSGACLFRLGQATASLCAVGTTCLRVDPGLPGGECVPPGMKNDLCGAGYGGRGCATGLFCTDPTKGTCQELHKENDSCSSTSQCEPAFFCNRSLAASSLGTCVPRITAGTSCATTYDDAGYPKSVLCAEGHDCSYLSLDGGVPEQFCVHRGAIGDPCSEPFQSCRTPLECHGGVCALPTCGDAGPG